MAWTDLKDLKAQLMRLWDRGEFLRDVVTAETRFPLRLKLRSPTSSDITSRFDEVRAWTAELAAVSGVRIDRRELRHRIQGSQTLPADAWIESIEDALTLLGKRAEWTRFQAQVAATRESHPKLLPWLAKRPLQALALSTDWPRLLAVVAWVAEHPRPAMYLRQVDLPGVHSKFIEAHRSVLSELLDLALPADAVDTTQRGVGQFAARYGFLSKPIRIRFRILDPGLQFVPGITCPDTTLDADSFSRIDIPLQRVFVTENETNFLAFPRTPNAIVIFGAGYGWDALARSDWLNGCTIHYWGDIDTHGFAILDNLRRHFGHVESFLMDRATLDAHASVWGTEAAPLKIDLHRLTPAENSLYMDLRDDHIRAGLRLEQEHIGFQWVNSGLQRLLDG